jgi:hypothetical protein
MLVIIGLAVNTGETKYIEIGRHRDMIVNEDIRIGINSYEKGEPLNIRLFSNKSNFHTGGNKM